MRPRSPLSVLPLVLALAAALALPRPSRAQQPPPTADQLVGAVQRFYDQLHSLRTRFYLTQFQRVTNHTIRSWGSMIVKKPGKIRFDFDDDPRCGLQQGAVTVSDGQHIQVYTRGEDGEPGTVGEVAMTDSELSGPLAFLLGTGRIDAQFTARVVPPPADFHPAATDPRYVLEPEVLELTPKAPTAQYEKVLLYVGYNRQLGAGTVLRVLIINHTGDRTRYDFTGQQTVNDHSGVRDEDFRFTAPAGTQRITPANPR